MIGNELAIATIYPSEYQPETLLGSTLRAVENPKSEYENDRYYTRFGVIEARDEARKLALRIHKIDLIYPATEKDVVYMRQHERAVVYETAEIYKHRVLPYIEQLSRDPEHARWYVNNLKKDNSTLDFVIAEDMKWNKDIEGSIHLLVLFRDDGLRSIRDLRGEHVSMLKKVEEEVLGALSRYNFRKDQVLMYFHYHPTFYRLHLHIVDISSADYDSAAHSHYLTDVVMNLEMDGSYYEKRTLVYTLDKGGELYRKITEDKEILSSK